MEIDLSNGLCIVQGLYGIHGSQDHIEFHHVLLVSYLLLHILGVDHYCFRNTTHLLETQFVPFAILCMDLELTTAKEEDLITRVNTYIHSKVNRCGHLVGYNDLTLYQDHIGCL